jgi:hypothetical protein
VCVSLSVCVCVGGGGGGGGGGPPRTGESIRTSCVVMVCNNARTESGVTALAQNMSEAKQLNHTTARSVPRT